VDNRNEGHQIGINEEVKSDLLKLLGKTPSNSSTLAVLAFLYLFGKLSKGNSGIRAKFRTELPINAGLGSSAAYSVCLAAGLLHYFRWLDLHEVAPDQGNKINEWAFVAEKIIHGSPSGIDNTIATFGKGGSNRSYGFTWNPCLSNDVFQNIHYRRGFFCPRQSIGIP
jgi:mevalonate kinase